MRRGKLKIFFGMLPGVGKTYAMLQAAHTEADKGVKVVAGCMGCNIYAETCTLLEGLTIVPPKKTVCDGIPFEGPDVEAILKEHPQLVLITDLAYNSAPECRNAKRYLDIEELLDKGIDVYATLNMIYLESCVDPVAQITGFHAAQMLPDEIFEQADEVELIDIKPNKLLARIADGKVNIDGYPEKTIENFLQKEKLAALRKMSFRLMADRLDTQQHLQKTRKARARILVMVNANVISKQTLQRTQNLAGMMDTDWMALYVETKKILNEHEKKQLGENIKLVRQFGSDLMIISGSDPVKACLETARRENVSHIITERLGKNRLFDCQQRKFVNRLIKKSGEINVCIIGMNTLPNRKWKLTFPEISSKTRRYVLTILASAAIAIFSVTLTDKTGQPFLPFAVLLVLLVITIVIRVNIMWSAVALTIYAVMDMLIPPRFTFTFNPSDIPAFLLYFVVTLIGYFFAIRLKDQEIQTITREKHTNALFLLTKRLTNASDTSEIVEISTENIRKYFSVNACFLFKDDCNQLTNRKYIPKEMTIEGLELEAANRAFKYNEATGRFTDTLPSCEYTYYPLKGANLQMGVVIVKHNEPLDGKMAFFWDAFLTQISHSFENLRLGQLARKTSLLDESDKLYKTLFNSISHELRIPVATIMGASDILLMSENPEPVKKELYGEMLKASQRLNRLIENLLNISRLESGRIAVHPDWLDVNDLFNRVKESLEEELRPFRMVLSVPQSMPLVKLDFGLMEQVLYNLVYNSCLYTLPGTTICLRALYNGRDLVIQEMDRSCGFEPEDLPYVFDKFWRYKDSKTGGLGLGLSIVKGFVKAHKGTVFVENRKMGGVRFTITIPTEFQIETENE